MNTLLQQINPWWKHGKSCGMLSAVKHQAFHDVLRCIEHPQLRRFAVISGARRVGKTTVMRQLTSRLFERGVPGTNILYISFR